MKSDEAIEIIKRTFPSAEIEAGPAQYKNLTLFSVFFPDDVLEGDLDPVYSVDNSGNVSGLSVLEDPDGIVNALWGSGQARHHNLTDIFLEHYGVKGMKWGVRKDRDSSSGRDSSRIKKSGPSAASVKAEEITNLIAAVGGQLVPRTTPRSLAIQAVLNGVMNPELKPQELAKAMATSPTNIVGLGVSVLDSGAYRVPAVVVKNSLRGGWKQDPSLTKKNMSLADIEKKVVKPINPQYPGFGTTNNCLRATYSYEMRRRGFDVAATKTKLATGQTRGVQKVVGGFKGSHQKIRNEQNKDNKFVRFVFGEHPKAKDVYAALKDQPERSRGDFQVTWAGARARHSMAYEIINHKPVIIDAQSGKIFDSPQALDQIMRRTSQASFTRLDDKNLNSLAMAAWVKDAE